MNSVRLKIKWLIIVSTFISILAGNAVTVMLFSALGKTSTNSGWNYTSALYIVLATIPLIYYLSTIDKLSNHIVNWVSTLLCGALLGFYYGGVVANKDPQAAMAGAISLGILFAIGYWKEKKLSLALGAFISSICAYGFALFLGIQALALFSVSILDLGIFFIFSCVLYLWLTIKNFTVGITKIKTI